MKKFKKQKGMALITALLVAVIGFIMITFALYIVYRGTEISGIEKRYKTSLEASFGVAEIMGKEVIPNTIGSNLSTFIGSLGSDYQNMISANVNDACWQAKLTLPPSQWNCSSTSTTDIDTTSDITFEFSGTSGMANFLVFSKIVQTMRGNSNTSAMNLELEGSGVIESGSGMIKPMHIPYLYRVELQGEMENNPEEIVNVSSLYEF